MDGDADQFDCNNCPLMDAYDELRPENREAWALFKRVCSRFTGEFQVIPVLVSKAVEDLPLEESIELMQRFSIIYDGLYPPKPVKT